MARPDCKACGGTGTVETSHGRDYACSCGDMVWRDVGNLEAQESEWKAEIERLRTAASRAADIIDKHLNTQREKVADASAILRDALEK